MPSPSFQFCFVFSSSLGFLSPSSTTHRRFNTCVAWWLTLVCLLLSLGGTSVLCWLGMGSVQKLNDSQLCLILDDRFDTIDTDNAQTRDIELGGFG